METPEVNKYINCDDKKEYVSTVNSNSKFSCDLNTIKVEDAFRTNPTFVEQVNIKVEDNYIDDKVITCGSIVTVNGNEIKDYITKDEIVTEDNRIDIRNSFLSCDHCNEYYQDYCTKCRMLVYILDRYTSNNTDSKAIEEIPKNILEFRGTFGTFGVFTLKVVPGGVRFGPFAGLDPSNYFLRIKGGRFLASEDNMKHLSWMWYINPAQNIFEHNLVAFQHDSNLYYRTVRDIQGGEELLVYFGEEYENSLKNDVEVVFNPRTEIIIEDVFACTFCCLGFSTKVHLCKHKSICGLSKGFDEISSSTEIARCPYCKIYLEQQEYLKYHMACCRVISTRESGQSSQGYQKIDSSNSHSRAHHREAPLTIQKKMKRYKCSQCDYATDVRSKLRRHSYIHETAKQFKCSMCDFTTNRKDNLKTHSYTHETVKRFKCSQCIYATNIKSKLAIHYHTHETVKRFKCSKCDYVTNVKDYLIKHAYTHETGKRHKCSKCDYATNRKDNLNKHSHTHETLKQIQCWICDYVTDVKKDFHTHIDTHQELKKFICSICGFRTIHKASFDRHFDTHDAGRRFECTKCDYVTNTRSKLTVHSYTHDTIKRFKCTQCDYATKIKSNLKSHSYTHDTVKRFKCS